VISAGMNHFYCILQVKNADDGRDRLGELLDKAVADPSAPPLFRKMAEIFGVFTFPSDDHIGEYLAYGSEHHGIKWPYGQESRQVGRTPPNAASRHDCPDSTIPVDERLLQASGEITVPIILDMELDRRQRRPAVNVLNTDGYIANLPRDACIEVPATVDRRGIQPLHVGEIPETFAAMMRPHFAIHSLVTEAYRTGSKRLLLQALLLDPVVDSISAAERLLDEMLLLQRDFLPTFA